MALKKHIFWNIFLLLQCQSSLKFCNELDCTTQARLLLQHFSQLSQNVNSCTCNSSVWPTTLIRTNFNTFKIHSIVEMTCSRIFSAGKRTATGISSLPPSLEQPSVSQKKHLRERKRLKRKHLAKESDIIIIRMYHVSFMSHTCDPTNPLGVNAPKNLCDNL